MGCEYCGDVRISFVDSSFDQICGYLLLNVLILLDLDLLGKFKLFQNRKRVRDENIIHNPIWIFIHA
jgi:hypothetical protein